MPAIRIGVAGKFSSSLPISREMIPTDFICDGS